MNDSGVSCPPSTSMNPVQLFHEFLVTGNDPVTSLILGSSYRSNGKEDQWQIRLRVSWDTFSARSVFRLPRQRLRMVDREQVAPELLRPCGLFAEFLGRHFNHFAIAPDVERPAVSHMLFDYLLNSRFESHFSS